MSNTSSVPKTYRLYGTQVPHGDTQVTRASAQMVLEKKICLTFLPYMGMVTILVRWPRPFYLSFSDLSCAGSTWNMTSISPGFLREKQLYSDLEPRSLNDLDLWTCDIHCGPCTHLLDSFYQLSYHRLQYFCFTFSHSKGKGLNLTLL